jgi:hypothetical protein
MLQPSKALHVTLSCLMLSLHLLSLSMISALTVGRSLWFLLS